MFAEDVDLVFEDVFCFSPDAVFGIFPGIFCVITCFFQFAGEEKCVCGLSGTGTAKQVDNVVGKRGCGSTEFCAILE